jgi:putative transposase
MGHPANEEGCPSLASFAKLGTTDRLHVRWSHTSLSLARYTSLVPNKLHRYYGAGYLHFISTSCYQRMPLLDRPQHRDMLLEILERVRRRYRFVVVGYVVMPEHLHLLVSEPERGDPSKIMQAIKQGFARRLLRRLRAASDPSQGGLRNAARGDGHIWQARFYDFVVFTEKKRGRRSCATCIVIR